MWGILLLYLDAVPAANFWSYLVSFLWAHWAGIVNVHPLFINYLYNILGTLGLFHLELMGDGLAEMFCTRPMQQLVENVLGSLIPII